MSKKPTNSQTVLADLGERLRTCLKADATNVYAIGKILTDAHKVLEHGEWLPWLEDFGISEASARNYTAAHKFKLAVQSWPMFKSAKFADLKLRPSALYMLAGLLDEMSTLGRKDGTTDFAPSVGAYYVFEIDITDIEVVLVAAKDAWVGPKRLEAILSERHPAPADDTATTTATADETGEDDEAGADETEPKSEQTPRKPKSEAPPPKQAVDMLSFTSWVEGIWRMRDDTEPHTLRNAPIKREQIEETIAFLQAVAELLPKTVRGSADTELSPQQVTERMEALEQAPA